MEFFSGDRQVAGAAFLPIFDRNRLFLLPKAARLLQFSTNAQRSGFDYRIRLVLQDK